jgi:hypothetical protein
MTGQDLTGTQTGDKVRIRIGVHAGQRGIVEEVHESSLLVALEAGEKAAVPLEAITNYSLAARRAWETMPKRAGRPAGTAARKQMVSLRIEIDLWQRLGQAAESGLVSSREQAVNVWIRGGLERLKSSDTSQ